MPAGTSLAIALAVLAAAPAMAGEVAAPETTIDAGPAPGATINDSKPTLGFSSDRPGSTFACSIDGGAFAPCSSPHTLPALADGPHTFAVAATDGAGNSDPTPASRTFRIDTAPPDAVITKGPSKTVKTRKRKARVAFEFTSSEPRSRFECGLDGAAPAPCTAPATYMVRKGRHRFEVFVRDETGNPDLSPARYDFKVKRKRRRR